MKRVALLGIAAMLSTVPLRAQHVVVSGRAGAPARGHVMHGPPPPSTPVPSIDHPLPYNFNAVKPAPLLGRDPIPAPFSVPPGYYNRQHPLAIPYGYSYGYAVPDEYELNAPAPSQELAPQPPRELPPAAAPVAPPLPLVAPTGPKTMYVIPGCYGGNLPPTRAKLPEGCDIAKVRVLRPPQ